jgi:hypothetical protein
VNQAHNIPESVGNSVRDLITIGVTNVQIIQFIQKQTGCLLSRYDIDAFRHPAIAHALLGETESLLNNLKPEDNVFIFTQTFQGEERRAAILIVTASERQNLSRFGDVIWLDGTTIKNDLGWTTWPITLCDDRKELASGGVFFTAFENTESFAWFLQTLEGLVRDSLRTLFSDEDSALGPAIVQFQSALRPDVAHRICLFHKRRNFVKHVNQARVPAETQDEALRLFDALCKYSSTAEVETAIEKIRLLIPSMSDYLDTEIFERIGLFTEAFRHGARTLGYVATALSESANHMIRNSLRAGVLTLQEIRAGISQAYALKALGTIRTIAHEFQQPSFLEVTYGLKLHRPILRWIDDIMMDAGQCQVELARTEAATRFYVATIEGRRPYHIRLEGDTVTCECDQTAAIGMPCAHIVALYQAGGNGAFPVALIAQRWVPNFEDITFPDLPLISLPEEDHVLRVVSDSLTDDEADFDSDDEYDDGGMEEEEPGAEDQAAPPTDDGPRRRMISGQSWRYKTVVGLGKQIAQKAAESEELFLRIEVSLRDLLNSCTEAFEGQVRDVRGRPRGRPRKRGHSQPDNSHVAPRKCPLCNSISHDLARCVHYRLFQEEREHYQGTTEGRHCSLCQYGGHRKDNCPVMRMARERVAEERMTRRRD